MQAAHFSEIRVSPLLESPIRGDFSPGESPRGTIQSWSVSTAFPGDRIADRLRLSPDDQQGLTWEMVQADLLSQQD